MGIKEKRKSDRYVLTLWSFYLSVHFVYLIHNTFSF